MNTKWPPEIKSVLTLYPTAPASSNWKEMVALVRKGKIDEAKAMAAQHETRNDIRQRNVVARRLRIERVELFARLAGAERALRSMLDHFTQQVTDKVNEKGDDVRNLKRINELIHKEAVLLRMSIRIWFNSLIRDGARMGFKHAGDALLPIFTHNREAVERTFLVERALFEGKLVFGLTKAFASKAKPKLSTDSIQTASSDIIHQITKTNMQGLKPSEKIWQLTNRTEQDLKQIVAAGMANGENPTKIANKIKKYVSPSIQDASALGVEVGAGVYRSPYKNAMRLARTEMNRTYTKASVEFANGKDWVQGLQITLSPSHDSDDVCSDYAGKVVSPDEFDSLVPFHPHCMCYATYVIDPKYLGDEEAA